jgi:secreted PhoX family phosphatase
MSRRGLLRGGVGLAVLGTLPMLQACGSGGGGGGLPTPQAFTFPPTPKSLLDNVVLPPGYTYTVLHATGDRLVSSIPAYSNVGAETDDWSQRIGDHHDGMDLYAIGTDGKFSTRDTGRALLVVNHESSADAHFFHPDGQTSNGVSGKKFSQFGDWDTGTRPALEVLKEINHHGVSVVELRKGAAGWSYVLDSLYNRRVTAQTPARFGGPAAHLADIRAFMVTAYDPTGATGRGTLNNCGHGITPWGTYLACEENWAVYFNMPAGSPAPDAKTAESRRRYGVARAALASTATSGLGQGWYTPSNTDNRFTRWNIAPIGASAAADFRNEPSTFGYNVEIDPLSNATPVKRVAMGRFAHEGAWCGRPVVGKPLAFYQGCDSRNEYIYKFVTAANWDDKDIGGGMAAGDKYLNEGKLYAAKFNADGTGQWIELAMSNPQIAGYSAYAFTDAGDIAINTRLAADAVGATKMDRPEWCAVNPANGEIYFTLTNNSNRRVSPSTSTQLAPDSANPRVYTDMKGTTSQQGNPNGHILRLKEGAAGNTATMFTWDVYLFGAQADAPAATVNLSNLTGDQDFSSPDGLVFSQATGLLWIQTDDGAYTDVTNCMMLVGRPGMVGDGAKRTLTYPRSGLADLVVDTYVGKAPTADTLKRFLVGPKGAEITGCCETPDGKALFINIQHPGENTLQADIADPSKYESRWPANAGYGAGSRPRSGAVSGRTVW